MITQTQLQQQLIYNPETGNFFWRSTERNKVAGVAGNASFKGYIVIQVLGKAYFAHRLAWLYIHGKWPLEQIDHINRVKDDNRITNLREVSQSDNQMNTGARINSRTGIKGVFPNGTRTAWGAKYKGKYIGQFKTIEEAQKAIETEKANDRR